MDIQKVIIAFVALVTTTSQAFAGSSSNASICHWQDYNAIWKLITVSENAVEKHLSIHDDSLPGGVTSFTGIELDENCSEVATLASCGTCLVSYGTAQPGCSNSECQDLVGQTDSFCINTDWDSICVSKAYQLCVGDDFENPIICEP